MKEQNYSKLTKIYVREISAALWCIMMMNLDSINGLAEFGNIYM